MELVKLKVESFKKINCVEIPLSNLNILVGSNGSGKSSIIQAVHLACCVIRQADRVDPNKTSAVGIEELDYLPTDDYKTLGHGSNWGNTQDSPSSQVTLFFERQDGAGLEAKAKLRSARNAGISITGSVPADLSPLLRARKKFFTAYIPGISGIPNREECKSKKVILKACSYGDSNVILRNALLLLHKQDPQNIRRIEGWISSIIGPMLISVEHSDDADLFIKCTVTMNGFTKPLELAGTGCLQLIQIFCYVLLFKPGLLLIDEPDIHLHPHVQEKLVKVLADVAIEQDLRMLLTTHSPFIVRGAPSGTNVCWVDDGVVASQNRYLVEIALGWGAFGKKLIIVSEDANTSLLKKIVSQWPDIDRQVAFLPGAGYSNLITPNQAKDLSESLGGMFKIFVHRDRDSLTDQETQNLSAEYEQQGVSLWFPEESDVESYFCKSEFLELFLGCSQQQAVGYVQEVLTQHAQTFSDQFISQRAAHNKELYTAGGSPTNADVWQQFQGRPLKGAKGKSVFKKLKNKIPQNSFSEEKILASQLSGQIALDLKHKIEQILAAP